MQSSDEDRSDGSNDYQPEREKWSFGVLNDKETDEVPGTVILLSSNRNEPLGLRQQPARTSASSFPSPYPPSRASSRSHVPQMKRTADGSIVLDPQPDDSLNDPLNWPSWRRDLSLLSLGFYSMLGGGMTPILAAAYNDVSETFGITSHQVALTTGLYMLGLGLGSVVMSPTAILYGKRPIYLLGSALFIVSAVWCAVSPNFVSLLLARIFQALRRNSCEQTSKENGNRREGSYSQLTVPAAPDDQTSAQNEPKPQEKTSDIEAARPSARPTPRRDTSTTSAASYASSLPPIHPYTRNLQTSPPLGFSHSLQLFHGRLSQDKWLRVLVRPFILFAYPAVLWSAMVYALSVGWLIVLSEAVAEIFRDRETYNFSALGTGLVYISPFVGGIVGTVVAGKFSDVVVRFMTRRNGGIYEPEFRLVMAVPITLTTAMGLMGFGWSAQERDRWIVPTVFFGILSFGCSVGSTTAITFCVDSYRQYAGEALVTLNFSKNVLHGFVFSLFFVQWLKSDGARDVFVCLGGIHIACMLSSIPLYIYGKRARMWTVRRRLMEKF
ncbi:predicted protein [Histoplasma mississippiense (nom. inval.)]|uniref:predicted protein n=1 Tax=Ajellomyces capsulatus (strain NAm1 / WU24) TaxID=2059318 RepID=UPI000157CFCA|nr:predicted protein [Histoplasma mississippiense (nom. inval.)]EDN10798.1 predicted protein [Histoplasma mississippiense (nom. inval.)]